MKFWRRHKHELERTDGDDPLPAAPEKKMRYSRGDDILLARYFHDKPEGTSDKIFQAFGRMASRSSIYNLFAHINLLFCSILITLGKVGRSTIGFIKQRSIILSSSLRMGRLLTQKSIKLRTRWHFTVLLTVCLPYSPIYSLCLDTFH